MQQTTRYGVTVSVRFTPKTTTTFGKHTLVSPCTAQVPVAGALGELWVGVQVDSTGELSELASRLKAAGNETFDQAATTCCYARSEKNWITDPQGISWETFLTTGESTVYGNSVDLGALRDDLTESLAGLGLQRRHLRLSCVGIRNGPAPLRRGTPGGGVGEQDDAGAAIERLRDLIRGRLGHGGLGLAEHGRLAGRLEFLRARLRLFFALGRRPIAEDVVGITHARQGRALDRRCHGNNAVDGRSRATRCNLPWLLPSGPDQVSRRERPPDSQAGIWRRKTGKSS